DVRENAVRAVGWIGIAEPPVFQTLNARLRDTSSRVRAAAATSLGVLRKLSGEGDGSVPSLIAVLDDPDPLVRRWTVFALRNFGKAAQPAVAELEQMALQSDTGTRRVIDETLTAIRRR